ncbi:DNA-binding transcriptional regulator CytR [Arenicella sp. 4NH20-0111]|uniref:LacI family DNA-binding transcriptional regulator n=1 Tax=Arenicella sp. 4NH20-0111 TaxID=3127648 RepID=UPI003104BCE0
MSNIREIARFAGVSTATVSRALSHPDKVAEKTLKKVREAMLKYDYRPNMMARNFRATKSFTILVLVPNIANPFFSTLIRGIEDVAQKKGYSVLLGDTRENEKNEDEYLSLIETRQADGLIQLTPYSPGSKLYPSYVLAVNAAGCEGTPYPTIRIDNREAAKTAIEYFISLGHRRIGVVTGLSENRHTIDRLKGYKQALSEAGIEYDSQLVVEGEFTMSSGKIAADQIVKMADRPTAVFCMNDDMAIAATQTFKSNGLKVPKDISVIGFDNIEYSKYTDPPLTTIEQPALKLGNVAASKLIQLIEGETLTESQFILPHEFILRQSVTTVLNNS